MPAPQGKQLALLVGGPSDGKRIPVFEDDMSVLVQSRSKVRSQEIHIRAQAPKMIETVYERKWFTAGSEIFSIWIPRGSDPALALRNLIESYHPEIRNPEY